jgi:hypothetical protein
MDKTLRNTFIGALFTVAIAFLGAWIQINNRIAVLEVQVDNYVKAQTKNDADMEKMMEKIIDIQNKVTKLDAQFQVVHNTDK